VGTEVSSFSHDVLAARFFRGFLGFDAVPITGITNTTDGDSDGRWSIKKHNYNYLPEGVKDWITDDMVKPPPFLC